MSAVSKLGASALALGASIVALDQTVKYWVLNALRLPDIGSVPVAGPLHWTMVWNQGVSFGFFRADHDIVRWALAAFSIIVAVVLAGWVRKATRPLFALALGLVIGGAVGNVIDRIRFGAVVDFIDVTRIGFFPWVFNIADAAIVCGVVALVVDALIRPETKRKEAS